LAVAFQKTMSRRASIAHPELNELLAASQRRPIPEILTKFNDSYKGMQECLEYRIKNLFEFP
jgi:hypothetical protein